MRTVDLGKNSMGRLCLLGLLSLQSTLTSATTDEPSTPAVFNVNTAPSLSLDHFRNDDGTVNSGRLHSHHKNLEAKYLLNFNIANSKNEVTSPFSNTANPLQKRGVSSKLQETLVAAQALEAKFKANMKTKGKLGKRAVGTRASQVDLNGVACASGVVQQVPVRMGTPFREYLLMFDTASSLTWTRTDCKADNEQQCTPGRSRLSPKDSTTLMKSNTVWSLSYASGNTSGLYMKDVFQIGSATYDHQVFGLASEVSSLINYAPIDGVFAASFSKIEKFQTPTFFENLIKSQLIERPIISFAIKGDRSSSRGHLTIGGMDESLIQTETLRYFNVSFMGYWQLKSAGLTLGAKLVLGTEMECAIDTGSALLYLPSAVIDAFYATLPNVTYSKQLGRTILCKSLSTIKPIGLAFSGVSYSIPISSLVIGSDSDDPSQCKLAISPSSSTDIHGNPVAVIGTVFLKYIYTSLSYSYNKHPAVGFASLVGSELIIEGVDGAPLPPASQTPRDKDVKTKSIALPTQITDTKLFPNKTQTPPTIQTPVYRPSKDAGKSDPDHGGESGRKPTHGPDLGKGSPPDHPETTRHAAKKVEAPQDTEAGRPDPKEKDATKPHGKGVETPVPDVKGTKQHDAGRKSTPVVKEQPGAKDIGSKERPLERPPTPSDFHTPKESGSTKNMTAKDPVPKSKADKVAPVKNQHPEEHKPAASDKTPEAIGTKKEHNQTAGGKDKDGKTLPPADQRADSGPPTVQKVPSLNISGNGSDSQPGAPGGTNNSSPALLGNGTLPPDSSKPAQESHSAAPAIVSSVWSSSAVLVLVSAGFLLFGI